MKDFVKLNTVSVIYAFALFISIELIINVYRINRVMGWDVDVILLAIPLTILIVFILSTVLVIQLMRKWMIGRKISYWSVVMWFPYFIFFYTVFTYCYPLVSGETMFPIFNLLIYGVILVYPIYILIVNLYATSIVSREVEVTGKLGK